MEKHAARERVPFAYERRAALAAELRKAGAGERAMADGNPLHYPITV